MLLKRILSKAAREMENERESGEINGFLVELSGTAVSIFKVRKVIVAGFGATYKVAEGLEDYVRVPYEPLRIKKAPPKGTPCLVWHTRKKLAELGFSTGEILLGEDNVERLKVVVGGNGLENFYANWRRLKEEKEVAEEAVAPPKQVTVEAPKAATITSVWGEEEKEE
jgi:hypothetical protein